MKKILVPTDFSDCARRAEETATVLARGLAAELILLHVSVIYRSTTRGCAAWWSVTYMSGERVRPSLSKAEKKTAA